MRARLDPRRGVGTGHPGRTRLRYPPSTTKAPGASIVDSIPNRFANALRSIGIDKGDRVIILMPNLPERVDRRARGGHFTGRDPDSQTHVYRAVCLQLAAFYLLDYHCPKRAPDSTAFGREFVARVFLSSLGIPKKWTSFIS
jgi:hypothetical protein